MLGEVPAHLGKPLLRPLLVRLWPRLWNNEPPLPLADWAAGKTE